jgi:hypothetical protein
MQIPDEVVERVIAALNVAISIALVHAPSQHPAIMSAANALDDAVNNQPG